MIQATNLSKSFGTFKALDNVNLNIKQGSVYGLVGPNGAGKTTLIKTLTGIYKRDAGEIIIQDEDIYENNLIKQHMAYIPDDLYFFPHYRVIDIAHFYCATYPTWCWERYEKLKQVFQIDPNQKVNKMSKGMKRQVAFWMAVASKPQFMILDEPVDGLDPITRKKVWSLILQDVAEYGTTVLISSHNLRELEDICDHVAIMHEGQIILEKELDDAKSSVHKIQIAFKDDKPESIPDHADILFKNKVGSVHTVIMRGERESILSYFERLSPVLMNVLPLSLEEVFIYEIGGTGYEVNNIFI